MLTKLNDQFGRTFPYVRLSITDACNFRCDYCLPDGYQKCHDEPFLSVKEISHLVNALAEMGVSKIRLTGGEPSLRKDLVSIIETVNDTTGIQTTAITTNGYKLKKVASEWQQAGISALNVSVDSLDARLFHSLTGHDRLKDVLAGIELADSLGFKSIKLNAVLLKNINHHQLQSYLDFIQDKNITLRFIELMRTGDNKTYFENYHVSADYLKSFLLDNGWTEQTRAFDAGPAIEYAHANSKGKIGIIAPYSPDFCKTCNRLRITSTGKLRLCLFGDDDYDLRPYMQTATQKSLLQQKFIEAFQFKIRNHQLYQANTGLTTNLSTLGG